MTDRRYWVQTLGCPKNQVDSDKLAGLLVADGYEPASDPGDADLVVVNTCAFIEEARRESIDTVLELAAERREGARLVVTGCMAERYGDELAEALPEADLVVGFGMSLDSAAPSVPVALGGRRPETQGARSFDLLELPRPAHATPWAYVKVAEGCDRICGFCAIPSFRGLQRSRPIDRVLDEVDRLVASDVKEIVLVAQDLASYGRDRHTSGAANASDDTPRAGATSEAPIVTLTRAVAERAARTRLLYLYPSQLSDALVDAVLGTGVPYFDLSLQHVSRPHLRRMRRWGEGERFLRRIERIRGLEPSATFRSSFILGYPGETEADHDQLLAFLEEARLDWAGFFTFSSEEGTHAAGLEDQVPTELALERLRECAELQDAITARQRDEMIGACYEVLVDAPGVARTVHEAPEIDGVVDVPDTLVPGTLVDVEITASTGTDLVATPTAVTAGAPR